MNLSNNVQLRSHDTHGVVADGFSRLTDGVRLFFARWAARRRRARDVAELSRFSDRELWDLALSRSDLNGIAEGTFRRD